jgi:transcription-repair coupling factor (superfamily II helicase)
MQCLPYPKKSGDIVTWGNLQSGSLLYHLSHELLTYEDFTLIVTPDTLTAHHVEAALDFFNPQNKHPHFPDWETLPYDVFSPHQDILSTRMSILTDLQRGAIKTLITSISTLMHPMAEVNFIAHSSFRLSLGEKIHFETLREHLQMQGYYAVNQVMTHGEYTIRGSLMDIFPAGAKTAYRIERFDDEIVSIRTFDPETQLSSSKITEISLLPAREFPLDPPSISRFREAWRHEFTGNPSECPLYQQVSSGIAPQGIEYYLPLFFEKKSSLFDYIPKNARIIRINEIKNPAEHFWETIQSRFEQYNIDRTRPLLKPKALFFNPDEIFTKLKNFPQIILKAAAIHEQDSGQINLQHYEKLPDLSIQHRVAHPLDKVKQFIEAHSSYHIIFITESAGRKQALLDLFNHHGITTYSIDNLETINHVKNSPSVMIAPLISGFIDKAQQRIIITESELFGEHVFQTRKKQTKQIDSDIAIRHLAELEVGAPVVHLDHGVGRFIGLQTIEAGGCVQEYLTLAFAGNDKLYVPVAHLHLIGRYNGVNPAHIPLHKLGNPHWHRAKQKAFEKIRDVAAELLALYAKREAKTGFAFHPPDAEYQRFCEGFPFEETPDQAKAIHEVLSDMQKPKPMDRLVCGDVGFGKTEVAMRAAFLAVNSGKQVAVLVPTTLLSEQHYQNFQDRFADWPINIACLSRFRTGKEQKNILDHLKTGKIDIIIGTHKLLEKTITFSDLGLLIIDEEHRFGVHQKDKIKAYRAEVDILTLTATPIPRTLNLSLSGIRELSLIATPPAKRLSIKTFVHKRHDTIIREAILRELLRGGQIYYLHNKVDTINRVADEIKALIPEAKVNIAHGQMRERELERIISDFYHQRFNVLVCTTIIETGIDIPTANTMIIDDADHFGLAQLHQLRGRVGRSHHQAYTYLLTPSEGKITKDAEKRLLAIAAHDQLGVGFILANHDLEIRGAGDLLGEEQSGNIQEIGFSLYMELLEKTVNTLKSGQDLSMTAFESQQTDIDLKISALIPETYLPDIHQRLIFYKRLATVQSIAELAELKIEMIDRFGQFSHPLQALFKVHELRLQAQSLGIKKIEGGNMGGVIEFTKTPQVKPATIIELIQQHAQQFKLETGHRLRYSAKGETDETRLAALERVLTRLAE